MRWCPGTSRAPRCALPCPTGAGDLSGYAALSLRAAVDPVSALNTDGKPQAFTVRLTDGRGKQARVPTRPDEPAWVPARLVRDALAEGETIFFTGLVPLTTIRLALSDFTGVDLTDIREIALVFDRTPSGTLFMGDLEWVR